MTGPHRAVAATRVAVRQALARIGAASPGGRVLVACSGGADSLALAAAVAFEAPRLGLQAGAVIVDHGLQEGSQAVAARAAEQCLGLGLGPVEILTVQVGPRGGGNGAGPESRARDARYGAFQEAVQRFGAVAVLLGHTRDDQAEQVLLGLARGSGARSLAGMPARRGPYVRPLLAVARATTVAACEAAGLPVWVDPHNSDTAFGRVRARSLLPVLERDLGPGTVAALARSADLLRDDADALDDLADQARAKLGGVPTRELGGVPTQELGGVPTQELRQAPTRSSSGQAPGHAPGQASRQPLKPGEIEAAALLGLPRAIRTRVWRLLALEAGCPPGALVSTHIDSLDMLVTCWRGQGPIDLPGPVQGSRRDGRVLITAPRQVE